MRRLRSGSIGSISAWLPSRRSTLHHSGALSMRLFGQVRSARTMGSHGWYFSNGIFFGVTGTGGNGVSSPSRDLLWPASVPYGPEHVRLRLNQTFVAVGSMASL